MTQLCLLRALCTPTQRAARLEYATGDDSVRWALGIPGQHRGGSGHTGPTRQLSPLSSRPGGCRFHQARRAAGPGAAPEQSSAPGAGASTAGHGQAAPGSIRRRSRPQHSVCLPLGLPGEQSVCSLCPAFRGLLRALTASSSAQAAPRVPGARCGRRAELQPGHGAGRWW